MRIPCCDDISLCDNTIDIRPIYDHPLFQRLRHIKQLGQTSLVFPGATHSRLEHSLGVYALVKSQCLEWQRREFITEEEVRTLCVFALVHDIGHFPFSHAIEPILQKGHHANGSEIVGRLTLEIEQCGVNISTLGGCMYELWTLAAAVHHGLLGGDKIDYLIRDAHHTGFGGSPETKLIMAHTIPFDHRIVLEKTALHEVLQLKNFMFSMYARIYERSKCAYARRLMQKIYERMRAMSLINERELAQMTDTQFEARCGLDHDPELHRLYETYLGRRPLPWTGLLVCLKGFGRYYERNTKTRRRIIELEEERFAALDAKVQWKTAADLETRCAAIADGQPTDIFIQASKNPRRYILPPTTILDGSRTYDLAEIVGSENDDALAKRIRVIRVGSNDPRTLEMIFERADDILQTLQV